MRGSTMELLYGTGGLPAHRATIVLAMRYHIWTEGCQMNEADSEKLAAGLARLGWREAAKPEDADLAVVNTCVVRQKAEDRAAAHLGRPRPPRLQQVLPLLHRPLPPRPRALPAHRRNRPRGRRPLRARRA